MSKRQGKRRRDFKRFGETIEFDGMTYKKVDGYSLDLMLFGSQNVSALPMSQVGAIDLIFLLVDNITFLSVLYFDLDNIYYIDFKDPDNPFAKAKRNGEGMIQIMEQTGWGLIPAGKASEN